MASRKPKKVVIKGSKKSLDKVKKAIKDNKTKVTVKRKGK